jgi:lycopene beta-cyclase
MPIGGDFNAFWRIGGARVARIGLRGGFVQPASGRTVADAARNAALLAEQADFGGAALHDLFEGEAKRLWKQRELERGINVALAGTAPDRRRAVYDRLYRLDAGAILGFLAGRPGLLDRRRIQQAIKSQA